MTSAHGGSDVIDLRSDTVTQPTVGMRAAIANARVGDDALGDDPTVIELEERCADLLGTEAAIFCSTGTMSNQLALRAHTRPGDEVIIDSNSHIHYFESAPSTDLGRVSLHAVTTGTGSLAPAHVEDAVAAKPRGAHYAVPRAVCIENTAAFYGGAVVPLAELEALRSATSRLGLTTHLDGARLCNASVASGTPLHVYGSVADTLSMCFAKGLGAPFGSVLAGSSSLIDEARRFRKWYGGALHQAGFMAAAASYALDHHVDRLAEDHDNAWALAARIDGAAGLVVDSAVDSNMVMISLPTDVKETEFVEVARRRGVFVMAWSPGRVRAITHMGISGHDVREAADRLIRTAQELSASPPVEDDSLLAAWSAGRATE